MNGKGVGVLPRIVINVRILINKSIISYTKMKQQYIHSPEDNQSILIETSSCNLQFFSELVTILNWEFHMVSPQTVFT